MALHVSQTKPAQKDPLLNIKQAAEFLNVSEAWLARDRWLSGLFKTPPQVPYIRMGNNSRPSIRYRTSDLMAFLEKGRVA